MSLPGVISTAVYESMTLLYPPFVYKLSFLCRRKELGLFPFLPIVTAVTGTFVVSQWRWSFRGVIKLHVSAGVSGSAQPGNMTITTIKELFEGEWTATKCVSPVCVQNIFIKVEARRQCWRCDKVLWDLWRDEQRLEEAEYGKTQSQRRPGETS